MIWLHSYEELEVFLAHLNQFHERSSLHGKLLMTGFPSSM